VAPARATLTLPPLALLLVHTGLPGMPAATTAGAASEVPEHEAPTKTPLILSAGESKTNAVPSAFPVHVPKGTLNH
jgi:hypothetical protein